MGQFVALVRGWASGHTVPAMSASSSSSVDTSRTLEIHAAPGKALWRAVLGVVMTLASLMLVLPVLPQLGDDIFARVVGTIGALFFGLCTVLWLQQAFVSGPIVTISPAGLRDIRVAREVIPWRTITQLSIWSAQGQRFVVVALAPGDERRLTLTRMARWTRGANRRLGADGLIISPHGLRTDLDSLFATLDAHVARHR